MTLWGSNFAVSLYMRPKFTSYPHPRLIRSDARARHDGLKNPKIKADPLQQNCSSGRRLKMVLFRIKYEGSSEVERGGAS